MGASARLWVKICGIADAEAAAAAAEAGADAVGFVFAPSPRRVSPAAAARIAALLPAGVARVGVFVDPGEREVLDCAAEVGLTHAQLHGRVPAGLPGRLRELGVLPVPVVRLPPRGARPEGAAASELAEALLAWLAGAAGGPVLADTAHAGLHGGTGLNCDWEVAAVLARRVPLVLAGGLSPENVAEAVRRVRPFGVDVSSGVERKPGVKDPDRIARFVQAARAAAEAAGR